MKGQNGPHLPCRQNIGYEMQQTSALSKRLRDLQNYRIVCQKYGISPLISAPRFAKLLLLDEFSPSEVFLLGLLDPMITRHGQIGYISKQKLLGLQTKVNPADAFHLTEEKLDFYRRCEECRLPTPEILAVYQTEPKRLPGFRAIESADDWKAFLAGHARLDFVIKPSSGVHGQGFRVLHWDGSSLYENERRLELDSFLGELKKSEYMTWLIQELLSSHEKIFELTGSPKLQTLRVVTLRGDSDDIRILIAYFRIIVGASVIDNFNFGESGNLVGTIDIKTGQLSEVLGCGSDGIGLEKVHVHPNTQNVFSGFALPFWNEVMDLVRESARVFAPLRTVGWDVAITDQGVALIEGNVTWDPLPTSADMSSIAAAVNASFRPAQRGRGS